MAPLVRSLLSNPPWFIFLVAFASFTVGILALSWFVETSGDITKELNFCFNPVVPKSKSPKNSKSIIDMLEPAISLPLILNIPEVTFSRLHNNSVFRIKFEDFPLARDWSVMVLPISVLDYYANCTTNVGEEGSANKKEMCLKSANRNVAGPACMVIFGASQALIEAAKLSSIGCFEGNLTEHLIILSGKYQSKINNLSPIPARMFGENNDDQKQLSATTASVDNKGHIADYCANKSAILARTDQFGQLMRRPLMADPLATRLHLLYSSYFLFAVFLGLSCTAVFRRVNAAHRWSSSDDRLVARADLIT